MIDAVRSSAAAAARSSSRATSVDSLLPSRSVQWETHLGWLPGALTTATTRSPALTWNRIRSAAFRTLGGVLSDNPPNRSTKMGLVSPTAASLDPSPLQDCGAVGLRCGRLLR
jgi:hypothetical protein